MTLEHEVRKPTIRRKGSIKGYRPRGISEGPIGLGFHRRSFDRVDGRGRMSEEEIEQRAHQIKALKKVLELADSPLTKSQLTEIAGFKISRQEWPSVEIDLLLDPQVIQHDKGDFMGYSWKKPEEPSF